VVCDCVVVGIPPLLLPLVDAPLLLPEWAPLLLGVTGVPLLPDGELPPLLLADTPLVTPFPPAGVPLLLPVAP
jgi:hypothetical protein